MFLWNKRGLARARTNRGTLSLQFHAIESATLCVVCVYVLRDCYDDCIAFVSSAEIVLVAKRPSLLLLLAVTSLDDIAINTSNVLRLLLDFLFEFGVAWCIPI